MGCLKAMWRRMGDDIGMDLGIPEETRLAGYGLVQSFLAVTSL